MWSRPHSRRDERGREREVLTCLARPLDCVSERESKVQWVKQTSHDGCAGSKYFHPTRDFLFPNYCFLEKQHLSVAILCLGSRGFHWSIAVFCEFSISHSNYSKKCFGFPLKAFHKSNAHSRSLLCGQLLMAAAVISGWEFEFACSRNEI